MSDAENHGPGLRDISRWLTTPAQCGVYFSLRDLEQIGRDVGVTGLPRSRRIAVEQLFRSADIDSVVEELLVALERAVSAHIDSYLGCDAPALATWVARAEETGQRLRQMRIDSTS